MLSCMFNVSLFCIILVDVMMILLNVTLPVIMLYCIVVGTLESNMPVFSARICPQSNRQNQADDNTWHSTEPTKSFEMLEELRF